MKSAHGFAALSKSGSPGSKKDAEFDEAQVDQLLDGDHIRRHMRLVAMERAEALRMRLFLDRAQIRLPRPLIEL